MKEDKDLLRKKYKFLRGKTSQKERENVKINVEKYLENISSKRKLKGYIGIFWPIQKEVDLRDLKKKYPLALPKCESDKKLKFYIWNETSLKNDYEGIPSPNNNLNIKFNQLSMIFVPCLSIDKKFNRLGYGGGYFDRLRSNKSWRTVPAIGILTSICVSDDLLICSDFDIPLSGYITDKEIVV